MRVLKERMLIVWQTQGESVGSFQGAHLDELITYEDGSTRNVQRPLTEQDADDLLGQVESQSTAKLMAATAEIESLRSQIVALTAERDALLERLTPPHNPRMIDPEKWYQRFSSDEVLAIASTNGDEILSWLLSNMRDSIALRHTDPSYQMSLDHSNAIAGVEHLRSIGILSPDRAAEMLANSTPDEA
jgi:hypothetical protein